MRKALSMLLYFVFPFSCCLKLKEGFEIYSPSLFEKLSWPSGLSTSLYRPRTSILEVPHEFKSRRGSSVLWQGALSSFAKSFGGDFKPSVPCIGESHPMHVKELTSLLAKSREKSRWSGQPVKHTETGVWCRPLVVHPRRLHNSV